MADGVVKETIETKPLEAETKVEAKEEIKQGEEKKEEAVVLTEEQKEQERLKQETKSKRQNRLDRRFQTLTSTIRAKEADVQSWRETLTEVTGEAPPIREEYRTPEDFQAAMIDYREKIRHPKAMIEQAEKEVGKAEAAYEEELVRSWTDKIADVSEEFPDYAKKLKAATVPMSSQAQKAILRSDFGPHIAYYLAENQEEAYDLFELPINEQILEIGRLESKVRAGRKVVPVVPKTKEKEPNQPPSGVKAKGDVTVSKKDPGQMSLEEFNAWRKSGGGN